MIPKIIHYCWFSGDKKPKAIKRCIESWHRFLPDYKIKCWDGNSFDFDSVKFVRDAMDAKKYAFAADYVRLYALYTEGGIYLDSDVLVKRPFDIFLSEDFFCGTEAFWINNQLHYRMEAAIMGSQQNHPFVKKCLSYYENTDFSFDRTEKDIVMPAIISKIAKDFGYQYINQKQMLVNITVYPTSVFCNTLYQDTTNEKELFAIHQNAGSWIDYSNRGWLYRFCRKHDLMNFYNMLEKKTNN